jgi:hypothetical protein
MVALDSRDRVRRSQNAESSKKMQSQPDIDPALIRAESMRFASSELLKIETALVQKPSASTLRDALAFGFAARLRRFAAASGSLRYSGLPAEAAKQRRLVEVNGIEPMTSCLQSRRSPN